MPIAVAAVTGLRRGELLALRWQHVDLDKSSLYVAASLEHSRAASGRIRFKGPQVDNDLVFPAHDGSPWPPDTFTAQFSRLAKSLGMRGFRFHDLRHAFASLTFGNGVSIKEVQTLLGHSSPVVTLSVYARSIEASGARRSTSSPGRSWRRRGPKVTLAKC